MAEQLDDLDRKDLKEFKILMTVGIVVLTVVIGAMMSVWFSLPDYHVVYVNKVKVEQHGVGKIK